MVVIPGIRREWDASLVAQQILEKLSIPFEIGDRERYTSSSIGIALYPGDGEDAGTLLKNADRAMYVAKEQGRNTYQFYSDEINQRALERLELETSLRQALKKGELFLQYQPQIDLAQGRMIGVEALLRWRHPEQGIMHSKQGACRHRARSPGGAVR